MKRISIILPVYNVEKYLEQCYQSLIQQDIPMKDMEIIFINDESTDNSLKILDRFQSQNSSVLVLTQRHAGLSAARNHGLANATGKFIWFIDSDDTISQNCLKVLLETCEKNDLDALQVGPSLPYKGTPDFNLKDTFSDVFSGQDILVSKHFVVGAWSYIYKRDFLIQHSLKFVENIFFEDTEFSPRAMFFCRRIQLLQHFSVYNYIQRSGSIMHSSFSEQKLSDLMRICILSDHFYHQHIRDMSNTMIQFFEQMISQRILSIFQYSFKHKRNDSKKIITWAKSANLWPITYNHISLKTKLLLLSLQISPMIFYYYTQKR